ncbi:LysE family translocator [Variovorax sp. M-6]|uniref:LysE family translocator n=1 Tax=Variovorax sp. M-6 TaxID=3233041 RepID=UPI003F97093E
MSDIHNYTSFVAAILVFQLIPGAGTIAILNATARNGRAAGMAAVAGTLSGDILFMVAAVAGVAASMKANPLLFQALQWFGAAYLCWMGLNLVRARSDAESQGEEPGLSPWLRFRQALMVSVTNPKVMLFFVSFFPLFLKPDASSVTLWVMMLHVTAISLAYQAALVLVGERVAVRLKAIPSARKIATRLAGIALFGFGIRLAADIK